MTCARHIALSTFVLLSACWPGPRVGPEVEPTAGRADGGTTASLTFRELKAQIFGPSCSQSLCHQGNPPVFAPMSLEDAVAWNNLMQPATQDPTIQRVVPGDPDHSYLFLKLVGTAAATPTLMPLNGEPLPQYRLDQIREWISRGAPND